MYILLLQTLYGNCFFFFWWLNLIWLAVSAFVIPIVLPYMLEFIYDPRKRDWLGIKSFLITKSNKVTCILPLYLESVFLGHYFTTRPNIDPIC